MAITKNVPFTPIEKAFHCHLCLSYLKKRDMFELCLHQMGNISTTLHLHATTTYCQALLQHQSYKLIFTHQFYLHALLFYTNRKVLLTEEFYLKQQFYYNNIYTPVLFTRQSYAYTSIIYTSHITFFMPFSERI